MNVGFYYMANAMGRLVGTIVSGALYTYAGAFSFSRMLDCTKKGLKTGWELNPASARCPWLQIWTELRQIHSETVCALHQELSIGVQMSQIGEC